MEYLIFNNSVIYTLEQQGLNVTRACILSNKNKEMLIYYSLFNVVEIMSILLEFVRFQIYSLFSYFFNLIYLKYLIVNSLIQNQLFL